MEEFNSDERFLVPDSEDDLNSREPWDLISGLEALTSQKDTHLQSDSEVENSLTMSLPHKKDVRVFPTTEASESVGETQAKPLAYDTISSDIDSGDSSHNQTVIERVSTNKDGVGKISTPSESIGNLHFSQDVILVPETLDSLDVVGPSSKPHIDPFIIPDSPSQDAPDDDNVQEEVEITFKATSSSMNSQSSSNKIDSQGLHLHFTQSQQDSPEAPGDDFHPADAMLGDLAGIVTTPIKDPTLTLSSKKLSLKDAPPSPQMAESLPRPSFHLPSKLQLSLSNKEEEATNINRPTGGLTEKPLIVLESTSVRSPRKQPKKHRLFMDTEEEANVKGGRERDLFADVDTDEMNGRGVGGGVGGGVEDQSDAFSHTNTNMASGGVGGGDVASLVLTEEPEESVVEIMDVDQTMSYDYTHSHGEGDKSKKSTSKNNVTDARKSKGEESQSQAEFDGFDDEEEEDVETLDNELMQREGGEEDGAGRMREDSPEAPSSQITITEHMETTVGGNSSVNRAQRTGSRIKTFKVMRKVLKKKLPLRNDQKSSSTDESGSSKPTRSSALRRKMAAVKSKSKSIDSKTQVETENSASNLNHKETTAAADDSFTLLQSKMVSADNPVRHQSTSVASNGVASHMPPPMARTDAVRRSIHTSNETSPLEINKLNKRSATVSFQQEFLPKVGERERKTVREVRAIVVERETTIDILDDKGNILKQTITKEVTRTPLDSPGISVIFQESERILSPNVSPSRSLSTLTSGDLADVSSSSLSRTISSGSKGSNQEFNSQSYPIPAQRVHSLDSLEGVENTTTITTAKGTSSTTRAFIPPPPIISSSSKPDSKRSSSGSNTGQDLFVSPDMSLIIPHCSSGTAILDSPVNVIDKVVSAVRVQILETDERGVGKGVGDLIEVDKRSMFGMKDDGTEVEEESESLDIEEDVSFKLVSKQERNLRGNLDRNKQQKLSEDNDNSAAAVVSKGKGKRKMEEKVEQHRMGQPGKRLRQEVEIEDEDGEASGSSVSTGFVVQDVTASVQNNPLDKASTSKSKENNDQEMTEDATSVHDPVVVDIKSRLLEGEQVMGKWKDGFYYPGTVKKIDSANARYQLKFDDGSQRWVGPEGLLLAKELPVGQSVMVYREDEGYYECGMILSHSWTSDAGGSFGGGAGKQKQKGKEEEKTLLYHVERDDSVLQKCPRKDLLLSEDQAACLITDHSLTLSSDFFPITTPKKGDISLDNLVEGKRQHRAKGDKLAGNDSAVSAGRKTSKSAKKDEETPTVGHDAASAHSNKKRKICPVATSTPTPTQTTAAIGTPSKASTMDRLGGVISSPSVSRKSARKTRQVLFGKKLTPPPDLFQGYSFLLTHIDKSEEQRQEERTLLGDSSLDDTSFDDNADQSEETSPFVKDQLQALILAGGGNVLDKIDIKEIQEAGISQCYLVASEYQRTVKYLQALALNIKIISHQWILHSVDQCRLLSLKAFLLPAGISLEKRKLMECKGTCPHLLGQTILVVSSRDEFVEAWSSILALAKCHLPTRFPTRAVKADPGIDFVISDLTCPTAIVRKCRNLDVPLVSSEWVAQCLINNALVDPTTHDKYKHDYGS